VSESPEQPTKRRWVWKALLGIFALGGAVVLADWWSVQPRGSEVPEIDAGTAWFLYIGIDLVLLFRLL
jgi:ferric-dicitrate binding protein FerR (iron transport regulator)